MLASKIVCPQCHRALKASQPLAVGKKVLCKQCGTTFRVAPTDVSAITPLPTRNGAVMPAVVAAPVAAFASPGVDDEPITTELDSSRLVKIALVAAVLAGGFLLIGGGSTLALVYALTRDKAPAANAKNDKPATSGRHEEEEDPSAPRRDNFRPIRPGEEDPKPEPPPPPRLPPDEQEKVDKAVEKGLAFIKKQPTNLAQNGHGVGLVALQGLTLLECGTPADDPQVKAIAEFIRDQSPSRYETYNISLAILFLDRLGDAADRKHIQSLALRLVAGQQVDGGWTYTCAKRLTPAEEEELLGILKETQPRNPLELFIGPDGKVSPDYVVPRPGEKLPEFILPGKGTDGETTPGNAKGERVQDIAKALEKASPNLKNIPGLQPPGTTQIAASNSDNSNTQFAILAVWVASRQDIPMERTLAMLVKRFRKTQDHQGRWGYQWNGGGTVAMTCAGLLGLGAGYGMTAGPADKAARQPAVQDKAVQSAFKALEQVIDKPKRNGPNQRFENAGVNLYFLWSLERVGVMYNVTNIGDKDWYRWGAEVIVAHQKPDGSWVDASYPGGNPGEAARIDTCFALLFLKRANLAKDLSKKLEYIIDPKDLGNK